jgi:MFS family permease
MSLLASRRLAPLLITQTLGAFNDNLFKNALVVLILFRAGQAGAPALVALAGGVFILPYVLLSATAGQIADKWEKSAEIQHPPRPSRGGRVGGRQRAGGGRHLPRHSRGYYRRQCVV